MPNFICPNCKERSVDIDRKEGMFDEAVACHHCGFGFLFELMDDYYPAPTTGLVTCDQDGRILGIATLHRTPMLPPGSFAAAAGVASREEREEASAQLCAEFMRHLSALGQADGVSRIDWVMVRATGTADGARSHLGATRVGPVALKPFAPGAGDATAAEA